MYFENYWHYLTITYFQLLKISYFSYVDSSRMVSVKAGSGADDLSKIINRSGRKKNYGEGDHIPPGEPCLEMYLKLAEHLMKKGIY